jgi:hypothetical protein
MEQKKKTLFIAGTFDDSFGKYSKIGEIIFEAVRGQNYDCINGGNFKDLEKILDSAENYNSIYWFADVPDEKSKIVKKIKVLNKKCILISSKRNLGKYSFSDLVYHGLNIHSNLMLEFSRSCNHHLGRILDPLGNVFADYSTDFTMIGNVLKKRVDELSNYKRINSSKIDGTLEIPENKEFLSIIKENSEKFHDLIHHGKETPRFFGNVSFRCESGFPSFKENGFVFVSRRNIDKRIIEKEDFVPVISGNPVKYLGNFKPSVDTPIQLLLYDYYRNVNYMFHSHVYVKDAKFTERIIPCGAVEEFDEIKKIFPDPNLENFSVNLKGHGTIVLAKDLDFLKNTEYVERIFPEYHKI